MTSAFDKEAKRSAGCAGNVLSLYEDRPNNWDAWDIDFFTAMLYLKEQLFLRNLRAEALYLNK